MSLPRPRHHLAIWPAAPFMVAMVAALGPPQVRAALPIPAFEENCGQLPPDDAAFLLRRGAALVAIDATGFSTTLEGPETPCGSPSIRVTLEGTRPTASIEGEHQLPGRVNVLRGRDPSAWVRNAATFADVRVRESRPGVDVVYHALPDGLEYDLVLAPGAAPGPFVLHIDGAAEARIDEAGDLWLGAGVAVGASVRHRRPRAFVERDGGLLEVASAIVPLGGGRFELQVADAAPCSPLVIDPVVELSTYYGSSLHDEQVSIAVDPSGTTVYLLGDTDATDFPIVGATVQPALSGSFDFAIVRIDNDAVTWTTYLGGTGTDFATAIAIDATGRPYVTGETGSLDYPLAGFPISGTLRGARDGVLSVLTADGSALIYSSYIGGIGNDRPNATAIGPDGSVHVVGSTESPDFPLLAAADASFGGGKEAFALKLDPTFVLVYSTFLGGGSGLEQANAVAVDPASNAYVGGSTYSTDFPLAGSPVQAMNAGFYDGFVVELDPSGALVASTYLGGSQDDAVEGVAVASGGTGVTVSGTTWSPDFPLMRPAQPGFAGGSTDGFVARFGSLLGTLDYSTYLGGGGFEAAFHLAVDDLGYAYVAGTTLSPDFPLLSPLDAVLDGGFDLALVRLAPDGSLRFASYYGGSGDEIASASSTPNCALDSKGRFYVSGDTNSVDFPQFNSLQPIFAGADDFVYVRLGAMADTSIGGPTATTPGAPLALTYRAVNTTPDDLLDVEIVLAFPPCIDDSSFSAADATVTAPPASVITTTWDPVLHTLTVTVDRLAPGETIQVDAANLFAGSTSCTITATLIHLGDHNGFTDVLPIQVCTGVAPAPVPLLAVKQNLGVALSWPLATRSTTGYAVWKVVDGDRAAIPLARASGAAPGRIEAVRLDLPLALTSCTDHGAVRALPPLVFYQVRGTCAGVEGDLRADAPAR